MPSTSRRSGFALRELGVVLLVLALLAAVAGTRLAEVRLEMAKAACDQNVVEINSAILSWYFQEGSWPSTDLSEFNRSRDYFPNGLPRCPVTGEPYEMDPRTHRVVRHRH